MGRASAGKGCGVVRGDGPGPQPHRRGREWDQGPPHGVPRVRHLPGRLVGYLVRRIAPAIALACLVALALLLRVQVICRRRSGRRPRLVWGPDSIINIKYWSSALQARGYQSTTCVFDVSSINTRLDFDRHRDEFLPRFLFGELFHDYAIFAWALRSADVFMFFLDGGFLRWTPLRNLEAQLLKLAGRRLVVFPYGADIAVPGFLGPAEEALLRDYPQIAETADAVTERVDYFARWADVMIRNYQYGYLPRADILWPTILAIDTDEWSEVPASASGREGTPIVVVHAPNHRHIKGTDRLIEVVDELRSEGIEIELQVIEGRPNQEVRDAVRAADIVGDQFIAGYAMFAIEGMAAGKPVLSALAWMDSVVLETEAMRACPIVDVNLETLKDELRRLATDARARSELGAAGRRFAMHYHSYEAVGDGWEAILDHVWRGAPLPRELPPVAQPPAAAERSASRHSTTERSPSI